MKLKTIFFAFFLFVFAGLFSHQTVSASEGVVEIKSTIGQNSRCYALSAYLTDGNYYVLVTCRDLLYPANSTALNYTLWATPTEGDTAIKLGNLGVGKLSVKTKTPFVNLFVSQETKADIRQPSGPVVMMGNVESISFLDKPLPTPTPLKEGEEPQPSATPTPLKKSSKLEALFKGSLFLPVVAFMGVIFFILFLIRKQ